MKTNEIVDLAARYVEADDMHPIPEVGELFYFIHRELPDNRILKEDEGWQFGGYGKIIGYEIDQSEKPLGKWIVISYLSLASFPPQPSTLRLQPPHIALGTFQSPDRTMESRFLALQPAQEEQENDKNRDEEATLLAFSSRKG